MHNSSVLEGSQIEAKHTRNAVPQSRATKINDTAKREGDVEDAYAFRKWKCGRAQRSLFSVYGGDMVP